MLGNRKGIWPAQPATIFYPKVLFEKMEENQVAKIKWQPTNQR